jgi:hypothetical protein
MRFSLPVKALMAGVLLAGLTALSATAGTLSYDPESCATPAEGMVYLAFNRIVLRIPANELTLIRDMPSERLAKMPKPPKADEPEGCPDHPIQARGFTFSYLYEAIRENKRDPQLSPYAPNKLKLINVPSDYWALQPSQEKAFLNRCEKFQEREELLNGLIACLVPPSDKSIPRRHWAVYLQAKSEVYSAPFGRPFVISCYPFGNGSQTCLVTYKLYETLNVSYEITVQHQYSSRFIPLTETIEFDRGLRAKIEAARVKDFVWPDL